MTEHTPGRWSAHDLAHERAAVIAAGTPYDLALTYGPNAHADARLIAAAPLMAQALQSIAALELEEPSYEDWGGDTEAAEQYGMAAGRFEAAELARAALAEAIRE